MHLMCLKVLLLILSITSFSSGFVVATVQDMVGKGMMTEICSHHLRFKLHKDDPHLALCKKKPNLFIEASLGFERGLNYCHEHFKCHRWNCTNPSRGHDLFGFGMARASKEAAVMFAMVSAGMVEYITLQRQKRRKEQKSISPCYQVGQNFNDFGSLNSCAADVTNTAEFVKLLLEKWGPHQKLNKKEIEMNNHNAAVGFRAIRENMQQVCRCVGLSGACNAKFCYKTLRPLKVSIGWLKDKYNEAKKVTPSGLKRDGRAIKLETEDKKRPGKQDLIYLLDSPNYCSNDAKTGSLGTSGRQCNACNSSSGVDSCESMCCGRGYNKYEIEETTKCDCVFNYCCKVKCKRCKQKVVIHRCK